MMAHPAKGARPCPIDPAVAAAPGIRGSGRTNARPRWPFEARCRRLSAITGLTAGLGHFAVANTLRVKPGGGSGAYPTVGAAVQQAAADYAAGIADTIYVAPGTYHEGVTIGTPLSLVGAGSGRSVIDAAGLPNGIYIDGLAYPGLSQVVVTGFTIENANFEGILVTNASFVTLWCNEVTQNDRALNPQGCPGPPPFETSEGMDCGEGIHLMAVDHAVVGNNLSENNDAQTPGPTGINVYGVAPITGTVISGNVITDEAEDVVANTPAQLNVHLNNLLGGGVGVDNLGQGTVGATENWWGSPGGPGTDGATTVEGTGVTFTPWLPYPRFPAARLWGNGIPAHYG